MAAVDNELDELRRRAYGRQADIQLDADALERLRELEAERNLVKASDARDAVGVSDVIEVTTPVAEQPIAVEAEPATEWRPRSRVALDVLKAGIRWVSRLRRSTVVIA